MIKAEADVNQITFDHVCVQGNCVERMLQKLDRTFCIGGADVIKLHASSKPTFRVVKEAFVFEEKEFKRTHVKRINKRLHCFEVQH